MSPQYRQPRFRRPVALHPASRLAGDGQHQEALFKQRLDETVSELGAIAPPAGVHQFNQGPFLAAEP
jgi:hypothetical protein